MWFQDLILETIQIWPFFLICLLDGPPTVEEMIFYVAYKGPCHNN